MKKLEHIEQVKLVNYLSILEKQKKIVTFFAIPNGGSRNVREATNLKKEGVRAGVSDICVVLDDIVLFIEMKRSPKRLKNGNLSRADITVTSKQIEFLESISSSVVCMGRVCFGFNEAKEYVDRFC